MKYCVVSLLLVFVILLGALAVSLGKPCDNPKLVDKAFECYVSCTIDKFLLKDSSEFKSDKKSFDNYYNRLTPKDRKHLNKKLVEYTYTTGFIVEDCFKPSPTKENYSIINKAFKHYSECDIALIEHDLKKYNANMALFRELYSKMSLEEINILNQLIKEYNDNK